MSSEKIKIELERREDSNGKIYYIGKLKAPISINCENGVAFLIFTSDPDQEELQISHLGSQSKKNNSPLVYKRKKSNVE